MSSDIGHIGSFYYDNHYRGKKPDKNLFEDNSVIENKEDDYEFFQDDEENEDEYLIADEYSIADEYPSEEATLVEARDNKGCVIYCSGESKIIGKEDGCVIFCKGCRRAEIKNLKDAMEINRNRDFDDISCIVKCKECKVLYKQDGCIVSCKCGAHRPECKENGYDAGIDFVERKEKDCCMIQCFENCKVFCGECKRDSD